MPGTIPSDWMPAAAMSRIHLHWTAGRHNANAVDRKSYHVLVEGDGTLVRGDRPINANAKGSGLRQASHTLNANTGAIGVSMCCMAGAKERPFNAGQAPMTEAQWQKAVQVVADLAERYAIKVTPVTVLTHAEVEPNLNIKQRNKWDITRLAFDGSVSGFRDVGERLRREVAAVLDGAAKPDDGPIPEDMKLPRYRVTGVHPSTLNFRDAPNGIKRGSLPERSIVERIAVIGNWWQVRTRAGYVGWVFSDYLKAV
ncbi:MAG: N-acetylmuramoyl-L-alanine amidase [Paracoccaceae bacterium]